MSEDEAARIERRLSAIDNAVAETRADVLRARGDIMARIDRLQAELRRNRTAFLSGSEFMWATWCNKTAESWETRLISPADWSRLLDPAGPASASRSTTRCTTN